MAVQTRVNNDTTPFILGGQSLIKKGTIAKNVSRTTVLKKYTVLAQLVSGGKYTPFVALNATTGASVPTAIYMGDDIAAADLAAGDIEDVDILVGGGCLVDKNQVVYDDGTLSNASVVIAIASAFWTMTAEKCLGLFGIYQQDTIDISEIEN
jgi:hypothetical protein